MIQGFQIQPNAGLVDIGPFRKIATVAQTGLQALINGQEEGFRITVLNAAGTAFVNQLPLTNALVLWLREPGCKAKVETNLSHPFKLLFMGATLPDEDLPVMYGSLSANGRPYIGEVGFADGYVLPVTIGGPTPLPVALTGPLFAPPVAVVAPADDVGHTIAPLYLLPPAGFSPSLASIQNQGSDPILAYNGILSGTPTSAEMQGKSYVIFGGQQSDVPVNSVNGLWLVSTTLADVPAVVAFVKGYTY